MGPDSAAPSSKICVEVKDKAGVTLSSAREEIEVGRNNRGAQIGLYVFSSQQSPPQGMEDQPFARYGDDIFVVWDQNDPNSNVFLQAGFTTARALCVRGSRASLDQSTLSEEDFAELTSAVLDIEKRASKLSQISTWTRTIVSNGEKILKQVKDTEKSMANNLEVVNDKIRRIMDSRPS